MSTRHPDRLRDLGRSQADGDRRIHRVEQVGDHPPGFFAVIRSRLGKGTDRLENGVGIGEDLANCQRLPASDRGAQPL